MKRINWKNCQPIIAHAIVGQVTHRQDSCKFRESTCHYCGKIGHIQSVCCSRISSRPSSNRTFSSDSYSSSIPRNRSYRPSTNHPLSTTTSRRSSPPRSHHNRSSVVKQVVEEPDIVNNPEYSLFSLPSGSHSPLHVSVSYQQYSANN